MYMYVHMRNFLVGSRPYRVPQAHTLVGESRANRCADCYQGAHQCRADHRIKLPYVIDVFSRDHQHMAGMVLSRINERDGQVILVDHVPGRSASHDVAKDAFVDHIEDPGLPMRNLYCTTSLLAGNDYGRTKAPLTHTRPC